MASRPGHISPNPSGLSALTDQYLPNQPLRRIAFRDPSDQSTSDLISLRNRNVQWRLAIYPTSSPAACLPLGGSYSMPRAIGFFTPALLDLAPWRQSVSSPPAAMLTATTHGDIVIYARTAQGIVAHLLHLRGLDHDSGAALRTKPAHIRGSPDRLPS